MGLSEAAGSVDEKGVIIESRPLRNRPAGCVSEFIRISDYKIIKGVFEIEWGECSADEGCLFRLLDLLGWETVYLSEDSVFYRLGALSCIIYRDLYLVSEIFLEFILKHTYVISVDLAVPDVGLS